MRLYRIFPWSADAAETEPGGVFYAPHSNINRISNPDLYRELYLAAPAEAALAEALGDLAVWRESTFRHPVGTLALAAYELDDDAPVVNLDDVATLRDLGIARPSRVVTPNRQTTQAWARRIYESRTPVGVRWWSHYNADWIVYAIWTLDELRAENAPINLSVRSAEVVRAARAIAKQRIV